MVNWYELANNVPQIIRLRIKLELIVLNKDFCFGNLRIEKHTTVQQFYFEYFLPKGPIQM